MPTKPPPSSNLVRKQWTQRGKIVYERPKHQFTIKDLIRIARKVDLSLKEEGAPEEIISFIIDLLHEILQQLSYSILQKLEDTGVISTLVSVLLSVLAEIAYKASEAIRDWIFTKIKEFLE